MARLYQVNYQISGHKSMFERGGKFVGVGDSVNRRTCKGPRLNPSEVISREAMLSQQTGKSSGEQRVTCGQPSI